MWLLVIVNSCHSGASISQVNTSSLITDATINSAISGIWQVLRSAAIYFSRPGYWKQGHHDLDRTQNYLKKFSILASDPWAEVYQILNLAYFLLFLSFFSPSLFFFSISLKMFYHVLDTWGKLKQNYLVRISNGNCTSAQPEFFLFISYVKKYEQIFLTNI